MLCSRISIKLKDVRGCAPWFSVLQPLTPLFSKVMCSRLCSGVNELNNNGETPLHVACRLGRVESVKALLGGGAKCGVIGGTGYAIHSAMKYSEKR